MSGKQLKIQGKGTAERHALKMIANPEAAVGAEIGARCEIEHGNCFNEDAEREFLKEVVQTERDAYTEFVVGIFADLHAPANTVVKAEFAGFNIEKAEIVDLVIDVHVQAVVAGKRPGKARGEGGVFREEIVCGKAAGFAEDDAEADQAVG